MAGFLYKCPGPHFGPKGTTYKTVEFEDDETKQILLSDGFFETLDGAADDFNEKSNREDRELVEKIVDSKNDKLIDSLREQICDPAKVAKRKGA